VFAGQKEFVKVSASQVGYYDEEEWRHESPSSDILYAKYYDQIHQLAHNIVCASCGCISHSLGDYEVVSITDPRLSIFAL
jgi:hypothetical protein